MATAAELSKIMKTAHSVFASNKKQYTAKQFQMMPWLSFKACLKTAWAKFKIAKQKEAAVASLTAEDQQRLEALKLAYEQAVYLPSHMSMSKRRDEIRAEMMLIAGVDLF